MDGEKNGKPYCLMDDLGGKTHHFRKPSCLFRPAPQKQTSSAPTKKVHFGQVSMHIPTRQKSHISTSPNRWNFALRKRSFKERGEKRLWTRSRKFRLEHKVKMKSEAGAKFPIFLCSCIYDSSMVPFDTQTSSQWRQTYQISRKRRTKNNLASEHF